MTVKNADNKLLGRRNYNITAKRENVWGYPTAEKVAQEEYEKAMYYLIAVLDYDVTLSKNAMTDLN